MTDERQNEPKNGTSYREQVKKRKEAAPDPTLKKEDLRRSVPSDFVAQCIPAKDLGRGMLYAAIHRDRFRFVKNTGEWLKWTGHHWEGDTMGDALKACEDVADRILDDRQGLSDRIGQAASDGDEHERQRLEAIRNQYDKQIDQLRTRNGRDNTLIMAHTCEGGLGITGEQLNANPWHLACANGVIDQRIGQLRNGRRDDYITIASPTTWDGIDAPAETWERSLLEIFNGQQELVDFLRRALGCALIGEHREKAFFVLFGPGGNNGKSLIMDVVRSVIGEFAGSVPSGLLLDQSRIKNSSGPTPDVMALKGLRLAIAAETDKEARVSTSSIKWLTGDDQIIGRNPNDKYNTRWSPTHTLFLLTNYAPHAPAEDNALWDRIHLIPFNLSFVDREPRAENERRQDKDLKRKLLNEAPGILAWLVRGCLEYQVQGLNPPDAVKKATSDYRREEDYIADFVEQECVVLDNPNEGSTSAAQLYERFDQWWRQTRGTKVPSGTTFGRSLARKFHRTKKSGVNHYCGVRLK